MAEAEKKKIKLNFGISKAKAREMAGETLTEGGMFVPPDPPPAARFPNAGNKPGGLSQAFNAAAKYMTEPMRPSNFRSPKPMAPSPG